MIIKEETLQYPAIKEYLKSHDEKQLEVALNIIQQLQDEHVGAGNILKDLRVITHDFEIPEGVCGTFVKTYQKIQELESDSF